MTTITKEQVAAEIRKVCEANPDTVNPMGENADGDATCLYTQGVSHCIAGEVVLNLTGFEIPENVTNGIIYLARTLPELNAFEEAAVTLLGQAQVKADNIDEDGTPNPRPWGEVIEVLVDHGHLA
jgi:hypothetical protein